MNNSALGQKSSVGFNKGVDAIAKVQRKAATSISKGSILERLIDFAFSIPDFRRTDKGNIRHQLGDIVMLMIFARMSRCVRRADRIEFGRHNLRKLQSLGLLNNGVPSEPALCRAEGGIDEPGFSEQMAIFSDAFHNEIVKACISMEIICIDGKAMCGTVQDNGRNPDIVSAYTSSTGINAAPQFTYTEGPESGHGRIEQRTYNVYDGLEPIADKDRWGRNLTVIPLWRI